MKQEGHQNVFTQSNQQKEQFKEKKIHWHPHEIAEEQVHFNSCELSPEMVDDKEKIITKIDGINTQINECLKLQEQSWKFTTFEANQFLKNTDDMIQRYITFLQKVQEFYDNHPEISKLLSENMNLKKDQDYFGGLLNKQQEQADLWYEKLKYNLTFRNELQDSLKYKKKKASQMLISRINLERILNSKKGEIRSEQLPKSILKRGRSNFSYNENEKSQSLLHRSLSSKKKNLDLSSIITSTNASQNKLNINDSILGGLVLPSITPQAIVKNKIKSSFVLDRSLKKYQSLSIQASSAQKLQNDKTFLTLNQNIKINSENNLNSYLNIKMDKQFLKGNDTLQQNQIDIKTACKTEMDISPIVRNAKKQLETLENVFKTPKSKGLENNLSSYNNLSYLRDKKKEMKLRLVQNKSQINQSFVSITNQSQIEEFSSKSDLKQQNQNSRNFVRQPTYGHQDSINSLNKISNTQMSNQKNITENGHRILNNNSISFLDQSEIKSAIVNSGYDDHLLQYEQELNQINAQIRQEKEEINQKYKLYLQKSRQFYRIEYFFQECLECSEKQMMKKIENLQLSGFELNNDMEYLLNVLDKFDDQGGVKHILSKQSQSMLHQINQQEQNNYQYNNANIMEFQKFRNLTTKQLLFSICRSSQMKAFLTKYLEFKKVQTNTLVNQIKSLMSQYQSLKVSNKYKQNLRQLPQENSFSVQKKQINQEHSNQFKDLFHKHLSNQFD